MEINLELSEKQTHAWELLHNSTSVEILFGGGAGGGKTYLMCAFSIYMALKYQGVRGFIGRNSLEDFKKSTMLTFYDILSKWGLKEGVHYTQNQQDKYFLFKKTGSTIYYNELAYYPSDPNYDYLGSTEYTWACIDEANQIKAKAKSIIRSRIRYKITENNLIPKLFMGCNPDKGYLYQEFFRPAKEDKLREDRAFVQSLVTDNPYIDETYVKNLQGLDLPSKERLLYGNWEYDDDPSKLIEYDAIMDIYNNIVETGKEKYIIADIARMGRDKTVVAYFEGLKCVRISAYLKLKTVPIAGQPKQGNTSAEVINKWREEYQVPMSHVLVDEDGVGGGVTDYLGCKGFLGGSRALGVSSTGILNDKIYSNLRTQCYFRLAKVINERGIAVNTQNQEIRDLLNAELEQVRAKDFDKDKRRQIMSKDDIKDRIGRSPDFADTLMMRMWYLLAPRPSVTRITI